MLYYTILYYTTLYSTIRVNDSIDVNGPRSAARQQKRARR